MPAAPTPSHCEQCGQPLPKRKRSSRPVCRVCAARAAQSFLTTVLTKRTPNPDRAV